MNYGKLKNLTRAHGSVAASLHDEKATQEFLALNALQVGDQDFYFTFLRDDLLDI